VSKTKLSESAELLSSSPKEKEPEVIHKNPLYGKQMAAQKRLSQTKLV
jgi:hypothetical protein